MDLNSLDMWVKEEECSNIIGEVWASSLNDDTVGDIMQLIKKFGLRLTLWNKSSFGHVQQSLAKGKNALKLAQERHSVVSNSVEIS